MKEYWFMYVEMNSVGLHNAHMHHQLYPFSVSLRNAESVFYYVHFDPFSWSNNTKIDVATAVERKKKVQIGGKWTKP